MGLLLIVVAAGSPMSPLLVDLLPVAIAAPCLCLAARWLGPGGAAGAALLLSAVLGLTTRR